MTKHITFIDYGGDWYGIKGSDGEGVPEGSAADWRDLLDAIEYGRAHIRYRLAGVQIGAQVLLWSPRNTNSVDAAIVIEADSLAAFVEAM